jgi:hypothetical protein
MWLASASAASRKGTGAGKRGLGRSTHQVEPGALIVPHDAPLALLKTEAVDLQAGQGGGACGREDGRAALTPAAGAASNTVHPSHGICCVIVQSHRVRQVHVAAGMTDCEAAAGRTCISRCCSHRGTRPGLCASICCTAASSSAVARCRFSSTSGLFLLHQWEERRGAGSGRPALAAKCAAGQHWRRRAGAARRQSAGLTLASRSCCRRRCGYYCWALVALPPYPDRRRGGKWKGLCRGGRAPTAGGVPYRPQRCPGGFTVVMVGGRGWPRT